MSRILLHSLYWLLSLILLLWVSPTMLLSFFLYLYLICYVLSFVSVDLLFCYCLTFSVTVSFHHCVPYFVTLGLSSSVSISATLNCLSSSGSISPTLLLSHLLCYGLLYYCLPTVTVS